MDKQNRKVSPLELLAQLKAGSKTSKHLPKEGSAAAAAQLDFSDLAAPAGNGGAAGATTESATAVAVAEPPPAAPAAPRAAAEKQAPAAAAQEPPASGAHLTQLFDRVNQLLGPTLAEEEQKYQPPEPQSLAETNLTNEDVEKLIYKFL